jgi:hypothetical protein
MDKIYGQDAGIIRMTMRWNNAGLNGIYLIEL